MPDKNRILAIIGGTANLQPPEVKIIKNDKYFITPFGKASAIPSIWTYTNGNQIVFLNRHGDFHQHHPSKINYPANFFMLKSLGVTDVLAISAVGSLQKDIEPGKTFVIPSQFLDFTHRPQRTFFTDIAVHVSLGEPFCRNMYTLCVNSVQQGPASFSSGATYVCIEGPQFSTRSESCLYKHMMQGSVIGMTMATEARLAREAGMCFAGLALPADYDSWNTERACVTADEIKETLLQFNANLQQIIKQVIFNFHYDTSRTPCNCASSLEGLAVHTRLREYLRILNPHHRERLIRKYKLFIDIE